MENQTNQTNQTVRLKERKEGFIPKRKVENEKREPSVNSFYDIDFEEEFDAIRSTN